MRNDTKTQITITMKNVDHANNLLFALNEFFRNSDMGGDCHLLFNDSDALYKPYFCGFIGHDIRKPKIELAYLPEDE